MQIAAESANLAPTCRNSQRDVKKLLVAAAAMMRSLSTVTSPSETSLGSRQTDTRPPRLHLKCRHLPTENRGLSRRSSVNLTSCPTIY